MDTLLNRYRSITVLLLVIVGQLVLLAYQVKNENDVRFIRVWAVTAVTPIAKLVEDTRSGVVGIFGNYFALQNVRAENSRMRVENEKLKLDNQFLRSELGTADRVKALEKFEKQTPSKMIGARIIGTAAGAANRAVFVDRGSTSGIEKGMAVVTPDGIVGKITSSYPTASQVQLITDPGFAAGVISQKNHVHGVLKGLGYASCRVDYVQNEEKLDPGEMFFTSGDDRIFPKGLPVGRVKVEKPGASFKDITVDPSGLQNGPEEVLIIMQGVHQSIPEVQAQVSSPRVYIGPEVAGEKTAADSKASPKTLLSTDADRLREKYKTMGDAQNHVFGEGTPGSKPPDFNLKIPAPGAPAPVPAKPPAVQGSTAAPVKRPPVAPKVDQFGQPIVPLPKPKPAVTGTAAAPPSVDQFGNPVVRPKPKVVAPATGDGGTPPVKRPPAQPAVDQFGNPIVRPKPAAPPRRLDEFGQPIIPAPKPKAQIPLAVAPPQ